jgi:hypothetical protein
LTKEELRKYKSQWRQKNKIKVNKWAREQRAYNHMLWMLIFAQLGYNKCTNCGYDLCMEALDFHHDGDSKKEVKVAKLREQAPTSKNIALMKRELQKGRMLCATCHRELHWGNPDVLSFFRHSL